MLGGILEIHPEGALTIVLLFPMINLCDLNTKSFYAILLF